MNYATTTNLSKRLRFVATDPMWADHSEINKTTLIKTAAVIDLLAHLLNEYVAEDSDTRHDGFDTANDDFPTHDEARKAEAVQLLRELETLPRSAA